MSVPQLIESDSSSSVVSTFLRLVQQNDPQAWEQLVYLYSPTVYQICRQQGLQAADAADIMQDVFRAVAGSVTRFRRDRPGDSFRGWIWTITNNKIRDHFRKAAQTPKANGGTDAWQHMESVADSPSHDSSLDSVKSSLESPFRRALDLVRKHFEERTWRAFWRVTVDQDSTADVAEDLGMSVNAVRKAKSRVLHRLREEFGELLE